jgi:hypothetical protein
MGLVILSDQLLIVALESQSELKYLRGSHEGENTSLE